VRPVQSFGIGIQPPTTRTRDAPFTRFDTTVRALKLQGLTLALVVLTGRDILRFRLWGLRLGFGLWIDRTQVLLGGLTHGNQLQGALSLSITAHDNLVVGGLRTVRLKTLRHTREHDASLIIDLD
jgi:hypothetical protein